MISSMTLLSGCSSYDNEVHVKGTRYLITVEHNGIAGANQDIKVITWGDYTLNSYKTIENEDGSYDVILNIKEDVVHKLEK